MKIVLEFKGLSSQRNLIPKTYVIRTASSGDQAYKPIHASLCGNRQGLYNTRIAAIATPLLDNFPQLRPLNIMRDLPSVADLVEKCFADTMDAEGHNYIQQMRRASQDNAFLRWASRAIETASMPLSGYVWVEDGNVIGNASLIPYHHERKKYYLIANVAVLPEYRNRGIGRALTAAAMQHAKQQKGDETWLHVRDDNPDAINLYRSLGFVELARRTTWHAQPGSGGETGNFNMAITRRSARDWPLQEAWLQRLYPQILSWYQPMPWKSLHPGVGAALYRFASDHDMRQWTARKDHLPAAMVSWQIMMGRASRLFLAVPPEGSEEALTALLLYIRRQLFWREKTSLDFPAGQYNAAIEAAGFQIHRTLLWMKNNETLTGNNRMSS
jgi:ribosomal protein S18 acetylase RimI-like enzyme